MTKILKKFTKDSNIHGINILRLLELKQNNLLVLVNHNLVQLTVLCDVIVDIIAVYFGDV